jgi:hypothetical protein
MAGEALDQRFGTTRAGSSFLFKLTALDDWGPSDLLQASMQRISRLTSQHEEFSGTFAPANLGSPQGSELLNCFQIGM